jgi:Fe2+ or Zn2+ uptake regulation protein
MITINKAARAALAAKGIKPTYQRVAILGAVLEKRIHHTIRSLYEALHPTIPTLSKTTLYTTLDRFARTGLVQPLYIDPTEVRYDGWTDSHHHFFCTECGAIIDLAVTCEKNRCGMFEGHRVREVHGYFKGVCKECLGKNAPRRDCPAPQAARNDIQIQRRKHHV